MERQSVFTVKRIMAIIFISALMLSACTSSEEGVTVHNAWMRPTVQGENGAVYFVLYNDSAESDELAGASSDASESVEMHESSMARAQM